MKPLLYIYNPHAGKGTAQRWLPQALDAFTQSGWLVTAYPTQGKADATQIAIHLGGSYERVVCCGGDGTLHEVISGLMALPVRPVVGYLPTGTTNDFSRNLHLPRSMVSKLEIAAAGVPRAVDIGGFNQRYFIYVAAFGAFTDVAYDTPQSFKNVFGHLAYVLEGATRLASLPHYRLRVEHDNGTVEGDFLYGMVSNTVSVGGFRSMPSREVKLDDGLFEVVLVRQPQNAAQLQSILTALMQPHSTEEGNGNGTVIAFHTSRLTVTCAAEMPWTLDGEFGGAHKVAQIENLTQAIRIVHGK
ncbi:MAG TPA: diacylglycerol kinase family lipid kinase [Candidatus Flavonifractor merdigallinarum]|uniref:Diacylglycerol kinase family lipid kinase n=1 Tax=Candidatus Flavonifractor merdigallinarum TaxID=2838589 RepID=A0A9D1Y9B7_9FIRM|nr:diacylglycerol kinase family lipid kinase [Candidatus Flavonifractor merdigallinarum]